MAHIDHERFLALKERVRAECKRRCYTGSVVEFGGEDYEFENQPTKGELVAAEHYEKLAVPLAAINSDKVPGTEGGRVVSEAEMVAFEAALATFETRSMASTEQGDCKSSCTGACYTQCSSSCVGSCGGSCSGTCLESCQGCDGCRGTCKSSCSGCSGVCKNSCTGSCSGGCKETCSVTCGYKGCTGSCAGLCYNGCISSCGSGCGGCGTNCRNISLIGDQG